jgi:NADH dehydrogenase
MQTKEIVIVGGGFAGINLSLRLADHPGFSVTLIDRNNYNFFPPLLYQVATGFLESSNICYPFRKLFQHKKNLHFRIGDLIRIQDQEKKLILTTGECSYDELVLATGTETNFFGMENVKKFAIPMKTVNDALGMRNHFLQKLEEATFEKDPVERMRLMTIVVAGGGPTGVEVSGMLAELKKNILSKDYPELSPEEVSNSNIYLVDAGNALLAPMSVQSQKQTAGALGKMGVIIKLSLHVTDYDGEKVSLSNGESIDTKSLIWAAGVTAGRMDGIGPDHYGKNNRLLVDEFNRLIGMEHIYAIGDNCLLSKDPLYPSGHPQVAQVAIQQARNLSHNLLAGEKGEALKAFRYHDKGSMAIIGRNKAVADLPNKMHFSGFIAWFIWVFVHLVSLINYRNRVKTLYNWMIAYFTKDQSLRMIIRPEKKK